MADIAVAVAGKIDIVESIHQMTLPATEAIVAGAPVRIHTDGKFTNANGTSTTENDLWGIATVSAAAGEPVTAVRRGVLDGFTFSQAYNAPIYVSDTDGRLGDAAGTASKVVGRVIPAWSQRLGTAADKVLSVEL
jgi:hypothetical protein